MISKILRQTWHEVRRQPVISIVSMVATAFTIFLVMSMSVIDRVKTAGFAPESDRGRMLVATGVNIKDSTGADGSTFYSQSFLHELYDSIDAVESMAMFTGTPGSSDISVPGKSPMNANFILADNGFWEVFDFRFISGKPYNVSEVIWDGGQVPVVVTGSVARGLYGSTDVVGQTLLIGRQPYKICGVVEDVSPLASYAYAQFFLPLQYENKGAVTAREDFFGRLRCVVVARDAADFPAIREEVARRYEAVNRRIAPFDMNVDPHSQPYTVAQAATVAGTNGDPDDNSLWWVKYMVLLLVPAINLSSMTSSLLRRRRMEIGVRRAFGATRGRLASGILMENLVVTVAGTLVGLAASWLFVWLGIEYFVSSSSFERTFVPVSVSPTVLFSWATFSIAGVCALALNLLSSGLPSWNAARRNPVEALSGHEK